MEEKSAGFMEFSFYCGFGWPPCVWAMVRWAFDLKRTDTAMPLGCGAGLSIYNLLRVFD
jgi:hypothetical protein